jgi:dihydrofolate synthase/folylpolyglutamate synthase
MAIALLYFLQADADIVVLEAGIGGLLDATNVIAPPLVSVITAVSMDHMQLLGNTVEEIAAQKAGILKTGSEAVFSADSRPEALRVLTETAGCLHIPYHIPDVSQCVTESCTLMGSSFMYKHHPYVLQMGGEHQIQNAITALEVLELLRRKGFILSEEIVAGAFSETAVPARIQLIQEKPPIILDGGHNADGVEALVRTLKQNGGKWVGICGMTNTKDAETASEKLASVLETVFCVDGFTERAFSKDMLAAAFTAHHVPAKKAALAEALPQALKWAHEHDAGVVICGSLYLANYYLKQ